MLYQMLQAFRIFNTWMGDHVRLVILEAIVNEIQEKNLLKLVRQSGSILLNGLKELEVYVYYTFNTRYFWFTVHDIVYIIMMYVV